VNLLENFRLKNWASIFAKLNNVAGERYMEVLVCPALRRNFRLTWQTGRTEKFAHLELSDQRDWS
jgi:hypothetical protein